MPQIEPFVLLDECLSVAGIIGAAVKSENVDWWHVVQLTAFVLTVFHVVSACKYLAGWILLLEFRWHEVQLTVLLCCCFEVWHEVQ